jgi:hypothetical protein
MKPSCTRCTTGLLNCKYPSSQQPAGKDRVYEFQYLSPSLTGYPPSPSSSSYSERSPSSEPSSCATSIHADVTNYFGSPCIAGLSDAELYQHYLQHTSHSLSLSQSDYSVLHTQMPRLAQQNSSVFHSLLAVSAVNIAWNMMSAEPAAEFDEVNQAMVTGYQHYNLASEQMRHAMSSAGVFEPVPLVASTLMLVPFATASQQVNHWLSSRRSAKELHKPLSSTPRDVIVIMRGVRATLQTIGEPAFGLFLDPLKGELHDPGAPSPNFAVPALSRTHLMSAIVSTTTRAAFSNLQQRLDSASLHDSNSLDISLSACAAAFDNLKKIRNSAFDIDQMDLSPSDLLSSFSFPVMDFGGPDVAIPGSPILHWLRFFDAQFSVSASTAPQPTEPLTPFFLSFLLQAPQEYLDLVLPLLDQRLEYPVDVPPELTHTQALALDIYAHWSVLMILVEEESWWIGTLPEVTLTGMVNRYGDDFVSRLWPENEMWRGQWWPGKMLGILRDIKQYQ